MVFKGLFVCSSCGLYGRFRVRSDGLGKPYRPISRRGRKNLSALLLGMLPEQRAKTARAVFATKRSF
eukprot:4199878-Pyramimonas_sp.AAC.1